MASIDPNHTNRVYCKQCGWHRIWNPTAFYDGYHPHAVTGVKCTGQLVYEKVSDAPLETTMLGREPLGIFEELTPHEQGTLDEVFDTRGDVVNELVAQARLVTAPEQTRAYVASLAEIDAQIEADTPELP